MSTILEYTKNAYDHGLNADWGVSCHSVGADYVLFDCDHSDEFSLVFLPIITVYDSENYIRDEVEIYDENTDMKEVYKDIQEHKSKRDNILNSIVKVIHTNHWGSNSYDLLNESFNVLKRLRPDLKDRFDIIYNRVTDASKADDFKSVIDDILDYFRPKYIQQITELGFDYVGNNNYEKYGYYSIDVIPNNDLYRLKIFYNNDPIIDIDYLQPSEVVKILQSIVKPTE